MSWMSGRTHPLPFSTGMILSFGKRLHRPCPMAEATVSVISRCCPPMIAAKPDGAAERGELAVADALPLVEVAGVAAVRGVHADDDAGLLDELPERVELGQRERARARAARARGPGG